LRQRCRVEVWDDARLRVEGRVVGVRALIGFGEAGQRREVGLARAAMLQRCLEGEITVRRFVGDGDDVRRERAWRRADFTVCRRAGTDFRKCVDECGREIAIARIDAGEAVPIVMRRVCARPAQRELDGEAQPLSLAR
jgi:hypothetical protein